YVAGSQPKHYYALLGAAGTANPKEGHTYLISANGTNTLTVDITSDDLTGVPANAQLTIIPYWTLGAIFPATDANVSFTPTTSSNAYKTQVRVPDDSAAGINLPYLATYYYSNNVDGTTSNVGWRKVGDANTVDHADDVFLPDSYFVVRHQNGAPSLRFTALGSVLLKKLTVPLRTSATSQQDNPVSILRPLDITLNMSGLTPTDGSFVANDQVLLFDNSQVGFNKAPSAIYYRDLAHNSIWRLVGDNNVIDRGNDLLSLGTGFVVRKAPTANGQSAFWTNTFPVQALSAVSRKIHGSAGAFDVPLPLTGPAGVESRNDPTGTYQIVVTFPAAVTFTGATTPNGNGTIMNAAGSGTTTATIDVTGVANGNYVTVNLTSVNDGVNTNDVAVRMGLLVGDSNGDGFVNGGDATQTRNRAGQTATASNFRSDFNTDGIVNSGDSVIARSRSGTFLPSN
ncbi:MAG: TIGR02597 family protein, partial [Verrucomicrobiota bacterium]|nr:TIGR02597 family protein [Verrucomicrobiota bacterium]